MKKTLFFVFMLVILVISASAQEYGKLKIIAPTEDCTIFVDGIQVGAGTTTIQLKTGEHQVKACFKDGTSFYNGTANIIAGELTTIPVTYMLNKGKVKEWGEGWGISIGLDNTDYQLSSKYGDQADIIGLQCDLSLFYSLKITDGLFAEMGSSLLRTYGLYDNGTGSKMFITSFPIFLGLKSRWNEDLMFGIGGTYSLWTFYEPGVSSYNVTPAWGYQIYMEIKPISSEIGYIVKKGSLRLNIDYELTSAGIYYKYKYYF